MTNETIISILSDVFFATANDDKKYINIISIASIRVILVKNWSFSVKKTKTIINIEIKTNNTTETAEFGVGNTSKSDFFIFLRAILFSTPLIETLEISLRFVSFVSSIDTYAYNKNNCTSNDYPSCEVFP